MSKKKKKWFTKYSGFLLSPLNEKNSIFYLLLSETIQQGMESGDLRNCGNTTATTLLQQFITKKTRTKQKKKKYYSGVAEGG